VCVCVCVRERERERERECVYVNQDEEGSRDITQNLLKYLYSVYLPVETGHCQIYMI